MAESKVTETYERFETLTGILGHLQNARGVADTGQHGRDMVESLDGLIEKVERKIAPIEKKLAAEREKARRPRP